MIAWSPSSSSALVPTYLRNIQHHASDTHAMHMDHMASLIRRSEPWSYSRNRTISRRVNRGWQRQAERWNGATHAVGVRRAFVVVLFRGLGAAHMPSAGRSIAVASGSGDAAISALSSSMRLRVSDISSSKFTTSLT